MRTFPGCVVPVLVGLAGLCLLAAAGCDEPIPDDWVFDPAACTDPANGSEQHFNEVVKPQIFDPYCSFCHWSDRAEEDRHGATQEVLRSELNYDLFEQATSRNASTWRRVQTRNMPPMGAVPTTAEAEILLEFLNCSEPARGDDDDSAL
jgi:hypothetical protein